MSDGTLVSHLMADVRHRIARRDLSSGARLPSIRQMAEKHGVSKSTVVEAYDRLAAEGVIRARAGAGFYVQGHNAPLTLSTVRPDPDRQIDPLWIMRQSLETPGGGTLLRPGTGWLPENWLPVEALRKGLRQAARMDAGSLTDYATPLGFAPLRHHLAQRLAARGISTLPDDILLTDSGSHALDLVCRFLLEPGDRVLIDDPCYFNFRALVQAHRAEAVPVPWTPQGPDLAAFATAAASHRPRLYLTNASLHNPTGASLSAATAHRLLRLAEAHDIIIVEDDIFGDFAPDPQPRLAALDGGDRVIHLGSYSKTLSAAIRCGYITARPDWLNALTDLKLATSFGHGEINARVVYSLLTDGSYRRHIDQMRSRLAEARSLLGRRLRDLGFTLWCEPADGLFLWAELPEGMDSAPLARQALTEGIVLAPGNVFSTSQSAARFLRFNAAQSGAPRLFDTLGRLMDQVRR
jgi:DNA-binding transcriptional MocR family regulator